MIKYSKLLAYFEWFYDTVGAYHCLSQLKCKDDYLLPLNFQGKAIILSFTESSV